MKSLNKEEVIEHLETSKIFTGISFNNIDFDKIDFINVVFNKCHFNNIKFKHCNLEKSDFNDCTFETVKFNWCDLSSSIFYKCKIENSEFYTSNLVGIRFEKCQLKNTSFIYGSLNGSWFRDSSLIDSKISCIDIRRSLFANIDFENFRFINVTLIDIQFIYPKNLNPLYISKVQMCPEYGEFYGFKKVHVISNHEYEDAIALIKIPAHAKRSSAGSRKCRASEAEVIKIWDMNGNEVNEAYSMYNSNFIYNPGQIVKPEHPFNEDWWEECASGIHFFMTKAEAEEYN